MRPGRHDQGSVGEERDQACMNGALSTPDSRESSRPQVCPHTDGSTNRLEAEADDKEEPTHKFPAQ